MKKMVLLVLMILVGINLAGASLRIIEGRCEPEGILKLTVALNESISGEINLENVIITASYFDYVTYDSEKVLLKGSWDVPFLGGAYDYGEFISEEAMLNYQRTYDVKVAYEGEADREEMICPGLRFSCSLLGTGINECYTKNNKTFSAEIILKGLNQSQEEELDWLRDMEYKVQANDRYEDINGKYSNIGSLPKDFKIESLGGDLYNLSYYFKKENSIKSFAIGFRDLAECRTGKYSYLRLFDYKECGETFELAEEVKEEEHLEESTGNVSEEAEEVKEECELPNVEINDECCEDKDEDGMCDKDQQVVELGKNYIWVIWLLLAVLLVVIGVIAYLIKHRRKRVQYY